ncbi:MAG: metallophosphoesterase [Anaerolineales bacterium]|nr:metallophosphoesterase [Anaerolineales bacterium]
MTLALILYNTFLILLTFGLVIYLNRIKFERPIERTFLIGIIQVSAIFLAAIFFPVDGFGHLQLLAWGVFLHFPLFLIGSGVVLFNTSRSFFYFLLCLVLIIIAVAVVAFLIEPQRLEVTHTTIFSSKLDQSLKIALLADIQTDNLGPYEARILALTASENPDLVMLAGDYLQIQDPDHYDTAIIELNKIFIDAGLNPPLGIYAVRGNVDHGGWNLIFQDLDIYTFNKTESLDLEMLTLTGVDLVDSGNPDLVIPESQKFHLVMGHSPNFSLGEIDADLLLAGHTHGGQFQLPGIGPILTLSLVPRSWASGLTEINPGQFLLVSRGIGLERGYAPRMRFLCRPELVILDLIPAR